MRCRLDLRIFDDTAVRSIKVVEVKAKGLQIRSELIALMFGHLYLTREESTTEPV